MARALAGYAFEARNAPRMGSSAITSMGRRGLFTGSYGVLRGPTGPHLAWEVPAELPFRRIVYQIGAGPG